MSKETKNRRILIVLEDKDPKITQDGAGFIMYMTGDKERLGKLKDAELTGAEFWALKLYEVGLELMKKHGALQSLNKKGIH